MNATEYKSFTCNKGKNILPPPKKGEVHKEKYPAKGIKIPGHWSYRKLAKRPTILHEVIQSSFYCTESEIQKEAARLISSPEDNAKAFLDSHWERNIDREPSHGSSGILVQLKPKYPRHIALDGLHRSCRRVGHQVKVRECSAYVSTIRIWTIQCQGTKDWKHRNNK